MPEFPALPLWTDAYLADTGHLSNLEHGIYLRALMLMWRQPLQRIPTDEDWISRHLSLKDNEINHFRSIASEYFDRHPEGWYTQKRLLAEWRAVSQLSEIRSLAGKLGGRKSAEKRRLKTLEKLRSNALVLVEANGKQTASKTQPPTPTPTPIKDSSLREQSSPAVVDLKAELFGGCLRWLASLNGGNPDKYRSVMGKWIRDYGEERVLQGFNRARKSDKPAGDPVAWMTKIINPPRKAPQI